MALPTESPAILKTGEYLLALPPDHQYLEYTECVFFLFPGDQQSPHPTTLLAFGPAGPRGSQHGILRNTFYVEHTIPTLQNYTEKWHNTFSSFGTAYVFVSSRRRVSPVSVTPSYFTPRILAPPLCNSVWLLRATLDVSATGPHWRWQSVSPLPQEWKPVQPCSSSAPARGRSSLQVPRCQ